jgi:hypothetical protein
MGTSTAESNAVLALELDLEQLVRLKFVKLDLQFQRDILGMDCQFFLLLSFYI